jgi:transposase-like protein
LSVQDRHHREWVQRFNLSPEERLEIIAKAEAGVNVAELVDEFQRSPNCIRTTIQLAKTRTTTVEVVRHKRIGTGDISKV